MKPTRLAITFVFVILGAFSYIVFELRYSNNFSKYWATKTMQSNLSKDNEDNNYQDNANESVTMSYRNKALQNRSTFKSTVTATKEVATAKEQDCSMWKFPERFEATYDPLIKLDRDLFLYPGLVGGPNNQIRGFYQSIYLAIRLNRTLVLPVFSAHRTHPGHLSPYQVVAVERVCRFVSCMSLEELKQKCNDSFDVAFETRVSLYSSITILEDTTNMKVMNPSRKLNVQSASKLHVTNTGTIPEIPSLPSANSSFKLGHKLPSDGASLRTIYNTTIPCAIVTSIFQEVNVFLPNNVPIALDKKFATNIEAVDDNVLFSGIVDVVQHPASIVTAAVEYETKVLQGLDYVAVHWRYNEEDWLKVCATPFPNWCKYICENVNDIKPVHVAKSIANKLQSVIDWHNVTQSIPVYIAVPTSLNVFRNDVYKELENLNISFAKPAKRLKSFLVETYQSCWNQTGWQVVEEIVSLCEMEIMVHSTWFFYSPSSTWSENIRPLRKTKSLQRKFEANVFDLAVSGAHRS